MSEIFDLEITPKSFDAKERRTRNDYCIPCEKCNAQNMTYPIHWEKINSEMWRATIRCGNCEEVNRYLMDEETIAAFDATLDKGTESIERDYERLGMLRYSQVFIKALKGDHILPEDF